MQMQVVLETDSIAGVASRRLAWAGDFDNVAPFETIIARHWISQLDTRKLRLLQPAMNILVRIITNCGKIDLLFVQQSLLFFERQNLVGRDEDVTGDVDQQVGFGELF